jgi:hypothetical protein
MGMAQPQDAFAAWLEAFAQDNDLLLSDDDQLVPPGQHQGQLAPDTQVLIAQLQQVPAPTELLPELDMVAVLDCVDVAPQPLPGTAGASLQQLEQQQGTSYGGSSSSKLASGSSSKLQGKKLRPKNTKRYKSQAQKDAHKRYRERKKQNVSCSARVQACCCCGSAVAAVNANTLLQLHWVQEAPYAVGIAHK